MSAGAVARGLFTILVFSFLGNLVALLLTIIGYIAIGLPMLVSFSKPGLAILASLAYGIWTAYPLLPLIAAGLYVALRRLFESDVRFLEMLIVAVAFAAAGVLFLKSGTAENRLLDGLAVAATVVAALLCWWLTRPRRLAGARP